MNITTLLRLDEQQLFDTLVSKFAHLNPLTNQFEDYLFIPAKQSPSICLVAHLDTVFAHPPAIIRQSSTGFLYSEDPQVGLGADDRCGVFILLKAYSQLKQELRDRVSLLFTRGEERGGLGARAFTEDFPQDHPLTQFRYFIEPDRRGISDLVYYTTTNPEFQDFMEFESMFSTQGFERAYGSFSDISVLSPHFRVASVNISAGYFLEHTPREYIDLYALKRIARLLYRHLKQDALSDYVYAEKALSANGERCDSCGDMFELDDLVLWGRYHLCPNCNAFFDEV